MVYNFPMGSYRGSPLNWRNVSGRGAILLGLIALHAVAIAGLYGLRMIDPPQELPEVPIEVVILPEVQAAPPSHPEARLQEVVLPAPVLPQVTLEIEPPVPPAAITVARAEKAPAPSEGESQGPVTVDQVEYLRRVPPRYPPLAKRAGAQGIVYLRVLIDPEGHPREVRVHRSSGFELLDAAAREAVLQFVFRPHRVDGIARSAQAIVPVEFSLAMRTAHSR